MTTSERLYRNLKQDITTCILQPGQPFSEAEICRRYRASRTPVREACRHLQREGLITIVPFRGYFVAPLTLAEFHNLHEVQLIVDPAAAGLAALRANPAQLKAMDTWGEYEYRVGVKSSYYTFLQRNFNLHVGIAQASNNQHLVEIVTTIQTRLMRFFYLIIAMDAYGPQLVSEHMEIVSAIRARNPETARQRAAGHVTNTIRRSAGLFMTSTETRLGELIAEPGLLANFQPEAIPWVPTAPAGEFLPIERGDSARFHIARASIEVDPARTARRGSTARSIRAGQLQKARHPH